MFYFYRHFKATPLHKVTHLHLISFHFCLVHHYPSLLEVFQEIYLNPGICHTFSNLFLIQTAQAHQQVLEKLVNSSLSQFDLHAGLSGSHESMFRFLLIYSICFVIYYFIICNMISITFALHGLQHKHLPLAVNILKKTHPEITSSK